MAGLVNERFLRIEVHHWLRRKFGCRKRKRPETLGFGHVHTSITIAPEGCDIVQGFSMKSQCYTTIWTWGFGAQYGVGHFGLCSAYWYNLLLRRMK